MKTIGELMLAAPFVVVAILLASQNGWKVAFAIFGLAALVVVWVLVAAYLLEKP